MGQYSNPVRQARLQVVADAINAGTGPGAIQLLNSSNAVLVSVPFDDPCGVAVNNLLQFTGFPKTNAAGAGGTITSGRFVDSTGAVVRSGLTVGLPGSTAYEVTVDALQVALGQNLTIVSAQITHP